MAVSLVGETSEIPLVPPHTAIAGSNGLKNQDAAAQREVGPWPPFSQTDMDLVADLTASILDMTGGVLSNNILAHILTGSTGPIVDALVAHYTLPQYGALKTLGVDQVKRLIQATQATNKMRSKSVSKADMGCVEGAMVDEVARMIQSIVNIIGYTPSRHMLIHILYGSKGPVVDELVARHNLAHYGCLKRLGFSTVKQLVGEIDLSTLNCDIGTVAGTLI